MNKLNLIKNVLLLVLVLTFSFAKTNAATILVSANITSNTTWTNNNVYVLVGYVYVTNGATLTIKEGTRIQGDLATLGSLIITRGSKINAIGTACKPIVFTSGKPVGQRGRGDWGGLIILGYSTINAPGDTAHIEGITPNPNTLYGGGKNPNCGNGDCPDIHDNSGVLQYVRIEYPGIALAPNNEINGLTMGGVGDGTTIDHIEVSFSNDDSYEWFGGTVNCKYLIAYSGLDDDFDSDFGYSGKVQFAIGMRDPNSADVSGSNSFESDNDASGSSNTPQTSAQFQNVTALGGSSLATNPNYRRSVHVRRNSNMKVYNSIMMGFPTGILVDACSTQANWDAAGGLVQDCYLQQASGTYFSVTPAGCVPAATLPGNIVTSTTYTGVLVNADYPISNPDNLTPAVGSPIPSANAAHYSGGFWTSVSYIGAVNPAGDNWYGDWTNFDPQNVNYAVKIDFTPTVTSSATNEICPNTGAIDLTVTAGITPYSYSWSNGATTQDLTGLDKGSYTVTVYDAGGLCSKTPNVIKVNAEKPLLTSCTNATSSSLTVNWAGNLVGHVTGYEIRKKKHTVSAWDPWVNVGTALSTTFTGLLSNTQYDFQLRGTCSSGKTATSAKLTCSTTFRLAGENVEGQVMNIYPNPNEGQFEINLAGYEMGSLVNLRVTDVLGKVVYNVDNISADDAIAMNLSSMSNGMYNVTVSDGVNQVSQKVMVSK